MARRSSWVMLCAAPGLAALPPNYGIGESRMMDRRPVRLRFFRLAWRPHRSEMRGRHCDCIGNWPAIDDVRDFPMALPCPGLA